MSRCEKTELKTVLKLPTQNINNQVALRKRERVSDTREEKKTETLCVLLSNFEREGGRQRKKKPDRER
jgi:hypothetical protein